MNMAELHHTAAPRNIALRGILRRGVPMKEHTSWRAGGCARQAYVPADLDDLSVFLKTLPPHEQIHFIGLGSNTLVRDGGLDGTVILVQGALDAMRVMDGIAIYAEAGVASPKLARFAIAEGFSGAEWLAGVPGTVGGALAMNAGCYGSETWKHVHSAHTIARDGTLRLRPHTDFEIGYRHCALAAPTTVLGRDEWFVAAEFAFAKGSVIEARTSMKQWLERRAATQPLGLPNAGSVFRNPEADHAARLIESCGLKGKRIGGAEVSTKHANFIVNPGATASAADIENLMVEIQATVERTCGVRLEREVRIIGNPATTSEQANAGTAA